MAKQSSRRARDTTDLPDPGKVVVLSLEAINCRRCGGANPPAARFCMTCGRPLTGRGRRWHWALGALAALVGSGAGVFVYLATLQHLGQAWQSLSASRQSLVPATTAHPKPVAARPVGPSWQTVHDPADAAVVVRLPAGWTTHRGSGAASNGLYWLTWQPTQLDWQPNGAIDWAATLANQLGTNGTLPAGAHIVYQGGYALTLTAPGPTAGSEEGARLVFPGTRQAAVGFFVEGSAAQVQQVLADAQLPPGWSGPASLSWIRLAQENGWNAAVGSLTVRRGWVFGIPAGGSALTGTVFQEQLPSGGYRLLSAGHMVLDESAGRRSARLWGYQRAVETGGVAAARVPFRAGATDFLTRSDAAWTNLAQPLFSGSLPVGDYRRLQAGAPLLLLGNNHGAMLNDGQQPVLVRATYIGTVSGSAAEASGSSWPGRVLPLALEVAVPPQSLEGMSGAPVITAQGTVVGIYVAGDHGHGLVVPLNPQSGTPLGGPTATANRYDNLLTADLPAR